MPVLPFHLCAEPSLVILQKGMSPVRQVLQENRITAAEASTSASEPPAWFSAYKQGGRSKVF